MRTIYMDEAGTSRRESVSVIVGVIVRDDDQWLPLRNKLNELVAEYVPEEHRKPGFAFHAKEIWHGEAGTAFDRSQYPIERRWELFGELSALPRAFNLPISVAWVRRGWCKDSLAGMEAHEVDHFHAFQMCLGLADRFISENCPGEMARVVAEDIKSMRARLRPIPHMLKDDDYITFLGGKLKATSITDEVHFVGKASSALLQIADAAAFITRRYLSRQKHGYRWFAELTGAQGPSRERYGDHTAGVFLMDWQKHPGWIVARDSVIPDMREVVASEGTWRSKNDGSWFVADGKFIAN